MDIENAKLAFQVLNALATLAIGVWLYLEKRSDKTNDRVTAVEEKQAEVDVDIAALRGRIDALPTHDHLGDVFEKINGVDTKVSGIDGRLEGIESTLRQLLNRIMERGLP